MHMHTRTHGVRRTNTVLRTLNLAWNRIGAAGVRRLEEFGPKKTGKYKRKVTVMKGEGQFLSNGDMPPDPAQDAKEAGTRPSEEL